MKIPASPLFLRVHFFVERPTLLAQMSECRPRLMSRPGPRHLEELWRGRPPCFAWSPVCSSHLGFQQLCLLLVPLIQDGVAGPGRGIVCSEWSRPNVVGRGGRALGAIAARYIGSLGFCRTRSASGSRRHSQRPEEIGVKARASRDLRECSAADYVLDS